VSWRSWREVEGVGSDTREKELNEVRWEKRRVKVEKGARGRSGETKLERWKKES
jgi:hypothetical protein